MESEAMREEMQSVSYSQEIDQRTGHFRAMDAATSAIRARAFLEVVTTLEAATK